MQPEFTNTDQMPQLKISMTNTQHSKRGFILRTALLAVLGGSVGCVYETHHARAYPPPPPVYAESSVVVQDDYVYYPGYQVYYSGNRHQYTYREGNSWVSRPTPPHVSAQVLVAAPSVKLDFHDAPAAQHATVVQTYPKNWTPPGSNHGNQEGQKKDKKEGS